jgi:hypothetical protein
MVMKNIIFLLLLLLGHSYNMAGQRYVQGHELWVSDKAPLYYLIFQGDVAYFEINGGKKMPQSYERVDTLIRKSDHLYFGKMHRLSKQGQCWVSERTDMASRTFKFRKASDIEYKFWVGSINWLSYLKIANTFGDSKEMDKSLKEALEKLFQNTNRMSLSEYELEVRRFNIRFDGSLR